MRQSHMVSSIMQISSLAVKQFLHVNCSLTGEDSISPYLPKLYLKGKINPIRILWYVDRGEIIVSVVYLLNQQHRYSLAAVSLWPCLYGRVFMKE